MTFLPTLSAGATALSFIIGGAGYGAITLYQKYCNGRKITQKSPQLAQSVPKPISLGVVARSTLVLPSLAPRTVTPVVWQHTEDSTYGLDAIIRVVSESISSDHRVAAERHILIMSALRLYFKTCHGFSEKEYDAALTYHIPDLTFCMLRARVMHKEMGREFWYCIKKAAEDYATDTKMTLEKSQEIGPELKSHAIFAVESFKKEVVKRHAATFPPKKRSRTKPLPVVQFADVLGVATRTRSQTVRV